MLFTHSSPTSKNLLTTLQFAKSCVHSHKFIVSSAVVALVVSESRCQNGRKVRWERVRKSWKTGAKTEAKTKSQNAATTPWKSTAKSMSRKDGAVASKAKKRVSVPHHEKQPHPRLWWGVRNLTHFLELFPRMLCRGDYKHCMHGLFLRARLSSFVKCAG